MACLAVWLNGKLNPGWPCGYNGWRLDLTPRIIPGGVRQLAIQLVIDPARLDCDSAVEKQTQVLRLRFASLRMTVLRKCNHFMPDS
jgi:hypothetical protein